MRARTLLSVVLTIVGAALLAPAAVALYVREQVVEPDRFAERAVLALDEPGVRNAVEREVVVGIAERVPLASGQDAQQVLTGVVRRTMSTEDFRRAYRAAALRMRRGFLVDERDVAALDLSGLAPLVREELRDVSPLAARALPARLDVRVVTFRRDELPGSALLTESTLRRLGLVLPLLAIGALLLALALAPARGRALVRVGVGVTLAGGLLAVGLLAARSLAGSRPGAEGRLTEAELEAAVADLFEVFASDLYPWALALAVAGLALTAAGWALARARPRH